jgi:hypothetical protein
MNPEDRERAIAETFEAMKAKLADVADVDDQYEILERLAAYLALIERGRLPALEARQ